MQCAPWCTEVKSFSEKFLKIKKNSNFQKFLQRPVNHHWWLQLHLQLPYQHKPIAVGFLHYDAVILNYNHLCHRSAIITIARQMWHFPFQMINEVEAVKSQLNSEKVVRLIVYDQERYLYIF